MTARPQPLFAREGRAAAALDMTCAEFRRLVEAGALPGPCRLDRWDMEQLAAIMRGNAMPGQSDELEI